jgi:aspartyl-tRNA(Asn)/glutamyl-tRNA(Gln) amidotransferase subunit A
MSSSDLAFGTLAALAQMLRRGETTSRAIVDACLARIEAHDTRLHAFIEVYADDARALADAADLERRAGAVRGPLHGLPVAFKDLLHIEGRQTTAGSKSWLGRRSTLTATVIKRLREAGMIPLGKTHMVEFAFGGWGRNEPMGAPWNPWDPHVHRVAAGSSSGSAVAVAAGLVPAALGSDTGGSIRMPAALCGLTGLKPTYGLVSLHGADLLSEVLDSIGPLAHTAEDAALVTAAIAGPDRFDAATRAAPAVDFSAALAAPLDLAGMRISVLAAEQFPADIDADVVRARDEALAVLRDRGARVEEVRAPIDFADVAARLGRLLAASAYALHRAYIEDPSVPIDPWVRRRTLGGKGVSAADYLDEIAAMRAAQASFAQWMRGRDALLTPTVPLPAVRLADVDEATAPLATFTRAGNYLGACGLSLPAGFSVTGLPVAIQIVGAPFTEPTLIHIGRAYQHVTDWHLRRPTWG